MQMSRKLLALTFAFLIIIVIIMPFTLNNLTKRFVNQIFEGQTAETTHSDAMAESWQSLSGIGQPNAAIVISRETLAPLLEEAAKVAILQAGFKAENIRAEFSEQSIRISADFAGQLEDEDINFSGTLTGSTAISILDGRIKLVPTLDRVALDSLSGSGYRLPGPLSQAIGTFIDAALGLINKIIQPIVIDTPAILVNTVEIKIGSESIVTPKISLIGSAIIVEEQHLSWLGELKDDSEDEINQGAGATEDSSSVGGFGDFRVAFREAGGTLLADLGEEGIALAPDLLKRIFGPLFAPGSPESRAETALKAAWQSATSMAGPDLSISVPIQTLKGIAEPQLLAALQTAAKEVGVSVADATVQTRDGVLVLRATAEAALTEPAPMAVKFAISVSVAPVVQGTELMLRPGLDEIAILSVESDALDTKKIILAINRLFGAFAAGLNAVLPTVPVEIEPIEVKAIELERQEDDIVTLTFEPAAIPAMELRVERIAALLTPRGLHILADVASDDHAQPKRIAKEASTDVPSDPAAFENLFLELSMLPSSETNEGSSFIRGAIAWRRVAELINAKWADLGGIRARLTFDTGREKLDTTKIELVDRPNYECKRDRKCTFDSCATDCRRDDCNFSCPSVGAHVPCPTWSNPLRFCYQSVEEPSCAARRVTCQAGREVKYQACVLDCNTRANLEKLDCDRLAEMEVAGCRLGAAIQDVGAEIGGVGAIGGDIRARGSIKFDDSVLSIDTEAPGLRFDPQITGNVSIEGSVDFTPYDVIGNLLTCPAGKMPFSSTVTIPRQRPSIVAGLAEDLEPGHSDELDDLNLLATVEPFTVRAKIDPPPVNLIFDQNPHLTIICNPIIGATVVGLRILGEASALVGPDLIRAAAGTEAAAILTGDVRWEVERTEFPISIKHTFVEIGEKRFILRPSLSEMAIALEAMQASE